MMGFETEQVPQAHEAAQTTQAVPPSDTPGNGPGHEPKATKPNKDAAGCFTKGNKAAKGNGGNPYAAQMARFRSAVFKACKERDIKEVVKTILAEALGGNIKAATLLLEITGVRVKTIDLTVNAPVSVDEARARMAAFFGTDVKAP